VIGSKDPINFDSKDEIDWLFRSNHVTLAFIVVERQYCKNSLLLQVDRTFGYNISIENE